MRKVIFQRSILKTVITLEMLTIFIMTAINQQYEVMTLIMIAWLSIEMIPDENQH